ncbi:DUF4386 domain-containing protein [Pontibacter sp. G13]|uniref:DUF4386 domain-containing protein n=1 Tax=Pontibacter sp. G13 TaxID=3074898 RepID=UPI00288C6235|nr:DUF4386 domain-containing protein [Pontibacter sp. G13]WNJ17158.1 DUF4386 domain-containing protein [Pontibacter sp. G13]
MIIKHSFHSSKKFARWTGLFYLLIITSGLTSGLVVRDALVDMADPHGTLQRIIQQETLYRIGFLCDTLMVISDVMVSVLFYYLLRSVHQLIALLAAVFRLMQSAILGANLINLFNPILMIQGHEILQGDQLQLLEQAVMTQLQIFEYGYLISGVFFAVNCAWMGYLLFHSQLFPKTLGVMIGLASIGYLSNCLAHFIAPNWIESSEMVMLLTAVIAELTLCLYLLIVGVRRLNPA